MAPSSTSEAHSGGSTSFFDTSTAGNGTFINEASDVDLGDATGGSTDFNDTSTAADGTFTNNGGIFIGAVAGGVTQFFDTSTAADGTFTITAAHPMVQPAASRNSSTPRPRPTPR